MRRALLLVALAIAGCQSREASLRDAVRAELAAYEGSQDRYDIVGCSVAPLAGEDRQRFVQEYIFEDKDGELGTCEVSFHFANFPTPSSPRPVTGKLRFVWLRNSSKWARFR
ncbi:MAG: hypothetical protein HYV09_20885 [Deltaproteobacteria bacterium]|nr:hypothetical protein [Deltaproteobacteria bacterium]